MIWIIGIITLAYLLLIFLFIFGFGKLPVFSSGETNARTTFSIVIPFRNEQENIGFLLSSLKSLSYPKELFEILLVNDDSEDKSLSICKEFIEANSGMRIKLLNSVRTSGSPKKDAVNTAIGEAENSFILTTDADCLVPKSWLRILSSFQNYTGADLISGPVAIRKGEGFLNHFQELDFFSLQAATIGAFGVERPIMCNAANLCYRKECFLELKGFDGNENIASGDDIFLLEKFLSNGKKLAFVKSPEAIVTTLAQPNLRSLFSQRIRWAAKNPAYKDSFVRLVGASIFLMNLLLVSEMIFYAMGYDVKQILLLSFLLKFNVDFILIYRGASFFGREKSMKNYFWASLVYPFFCSTVGILSFFSNYTWKGRNFRK